MRERARGMRGLGFRVSTPGVPPPTQPEWSKGRACRLTSASSGPSTNGSVDPWTRSWPWSSSGCTAVAHGDDREEPRELAAAGLHRYVVAGSVGGGRQESTIERVFLGARASSSPTSACVIGRASSDGSGSPRRSAANACFRDASGPPERDRAGKPAEPSPRAPASRAAGSACPARASRRS